MTEHKIVVVGSCNVGKSALTISFVLHKFQGEYDPTIEDNYRKVMIIDDIPCVLNIIDTAGQETYNTILDMHITKSNAFAIVYSITDVESLRYAEQLHEKIIRMKDVEPLVRSTSMKEITRRNSTKRETPLATFDNVKILQHQRKASYSEIKLDISKQKTVIPIILVGNKCDLTEERTVQYSQGHAIAKKYACPFYEVSAKESINVAQMFRQLVREIRYNIPEPLKIPQKCILL